MDRSIKHSFKHTIYKLFILNIFFNFSVCNNGLIFAEVNLLGDVKSLSVTPFWITSNPLRTVFEQNKNTRYYVAKCFLMLNSINLKSFDNLKSIVYTHSRAIIFGANWALPGVSRRSNYSPAQNLPDKMIDCGSTKKTVIVSNAVKLILQDQVLLLYHRTASFLRPVFFSGIFRGTGPAPVSRPVIYCYSNRAGPSHSHSLSVMIRRLRNQDHSSGKSVCFAQEEQQNDSVENDDPLHPLQYLPSQLYLERSLNSSIPAYQSRVFNALTYKYTYVNRGIL